MREIIGMVTSQSAMDRHKERLRRLVTVITCHFSTRGVPPSLIPFMFYLIE
jgi:hypothetical protein